MPAANDRALLLAAGASLLAGAAATAAVLSARATRHAALAEAAEAREQRAREDESRLRDALASARAEARLQAKLLEQQPPAVGAPRSRANSSSGEPVDSTHQVFKIVLTGGPCGGKSTALANVQEKMEAAGIRVFCVPEAATLCYEAGVAITDYMGTDANTVTLQVRLAELQMRLEDTFVSLARASGWPSLVLCDRGVLDGRAYCSPAQWKEIESRLGADSVTLRDRRYDAVVHLVTAADGAEKFYTRANNEARSETPEQARALDSLLADAWLGHPHHFIVRNQGTFNEKIRKATQHIENIMGLPSSTGSNRKFLLADPLDVTLDNLPSELVTAKFNVEQRFLECPNPDMRRSRVRRRTAEDGTSSYVLQEWTRDSVGDRWTITERRIAAAEYVGLGATSSQPAVHKQHIVFRYEGFTHELNAFANTNKVVLEVEGAADDDEVPMPAWIHVAREVTDDPAHDSYVLACVDASC